MGKGRGRRRKGPLSFSRPAHCTAQLERYEAERHCVKVFFLHVLREDCGHRKSRRDEPRGRKRDLTQREKKIFLHVRVGLSHVMCQNCLFRKRREGMPPAGRQAAMQCIFRVPGSRVNVFQICQGGAVWERFSRQAIQIHYSILFHRQPHRV